MQNKVDIFDRESTFLAIKVIKEVALHNINSFFMGDVEKYPVELVSKIEMLQKHASKNFPELGQLSLDEFYTKIIQPAVKALTIP